MRKFLKKESPVMWVSWGELIGMCLAGLLTVPGILGVLVGGLNVLVTDDPKIFFCSIALLIGATGVVVTTQALVYRAGQEQEKTN